MYTGHETTIRPLVETEADEVRALAELEDMGPLDDLRDVIVAHGPEGDIIGFLRLTGIDGTSYVNPIVVANHSRGKGIGRALMMEASRRTGDALDLVARGSAIPFYRALGAYEIPWQSIAGRFREECSSCGRLASCHPLPMRFDGTTASPHRSSAHPAVR